eukprot:542667-Rhodomonas_salina.1
MCVGPRQVQGQAGSASECAYCEHFGFPGGLAGAAQHPLRAAEPKAGAAAGGVFVHVSAGERGAGGRGVCGCVVVWVRGHERARGAGGGAGGDEGACTADDRVGADTVPVAGVVAPVPGEVQEGGGQDGVDVRVGLGDRGVSVGAPRAGRVAGACDVLHGDGGAGGGGGVWGRG